MNILWLSHFLPYPPKGGPYQRSYNLLREVSRHNDVYLLALQHKKFTHPESELENAKSELGALCREVHVVDISSRTENWSMYQTALKTLVSVYPFNVEIFRSVRYEKRLKEMMSRVGFDVVHYDTIGLAYYCKDTGITPKVLTHHDIESFRIRRRINNERNPLRKAYLLLETMKLEKYERQNCRLFNTNLVVSDLDGNRLKIISNESQIDIVENGVDTEYFEPCYDMNRQNTLIFAGRLDQFANRDGMIYFCTKVWPKLKEKNQKLNFVIIGSNPPDQLIEISKHDVNFQLLGYVDDVRPYFAQATACVCPIRTGGGTRIKILDALAMGMPIISTTIGCEGINVTPEKDIIIANEPEEFIQQTVRILNDPALRGDLSKNARKNAVDVYSWKVIGRKLNNIYSSIKN